MRIDEARYRPQRREMAYVFSEFMVPYLLRLYRRFDGDMAEMIVLGEIGQRNVSRIFDPRVASRVGFSEELLDDDVWRQARLVPCNALSIAESTGIPRETVRRKVNKLIERGWVVREPSGHLYVSAVVSSQFADFNLETMDAFLATAERIARMGGARTSAA